METIDLFVLFNAEDKPKGIITQKEFNEFRHPWWLSYEKITVSKADYDAEKITITNIKNYL